MSRGASPFLVRVSCETWIDSDQVKDIWWDALLPAINPKMSHGCTLCKSLREPPLTSLSVGHSLLVAHAHAVDLYRREFQPTQKGEIAITLNGAWFEPIDDQEQSTSAINATLS